MPFERQGSPRVSVAFEHPGEWEELRLEAPSSFRSADLITRGCGDPPEETIRRRGLRPAHGILTHGDSGPCDAPALTRDEPSSARSSSWLAVVAFILRGIGIGGHLTMAIGLSGLVGAIFMLPDYEPRLHDGSAGPHHRARDAGAVLMSLLTPQQQATLARLNKAQLVLLRFASDEELAALAERAEREHPSADQIKRAIKNWTPDWDEHEQEDDWHVLLCLVAFGLKRASTRRRRRWSWSRWLHPLARTVPAPQLTAEGDRAILQLDRAASHRRSRARSARRRGGRSRGSSCRAIILWSTSFRCAVGSRALPDGNSLRRTGWRRTARPWGEAYNLKLAWSADGRTLVGAGLLPNRDEDDHARLRTGRARGGPVRCSNIEGLYPSPTPSLKG